VEESGRGVIYGTSPERKTAKNLSKDMKSFIVSNITPCSPLKVKAKLCLLPTSSWFLAWLTLPRDAMEATCSSETIDF
jgi:hypothetical protein